MVCDRVSILNKGKIRRIGHVEDLIAGGNVEIVAENVQAGDSALAQLKAITSDIEEVGNKMVITASATTESKNRVLDWVRANSGDVLAVTQTRRTLEDIFYETVREGELDGADFAEPATSEVDGGQGLTYEYYLADRLRDLRRSHAPQDPARLSVRRPRADR